MRLSVIIITKDEAQNIAPCLSSVQFADEIIVVDSGSTDGTVAIARMAGATVIETADWPGFGPQKNRALAAATGDWVFSIDADERVTPALREEMLRTIAAPRFTAYRVPRLTSYLGRYIRHSGWYPGYVVRLFRRGTAQFTPKLVHESVAVDPAQTGALTEPLIHHSYRTDGDFLRKMEQYTELGAEQSFRAGKRSTMSGAIGRAVASFVKSYVIKRGFLDGRAGLMVAIGAAETSYHQYVKLLLLQEAAAAPGVSPVQPKLATKTIAA